MTRVRFDPAFIDDPRWERLGAEAYVQHSAACAYVVRAMSDGFVSTARARALTPMVADADAVNAALVAEGVWQLVDGGYHVCDCVDDLRTCAGRGDEQPSRTFVTKERERKERNKRAWKDRQPRADTTPNQDENQVPNRVQSSTAQHSAVQAEPSPMPALPPHDADDGNVGDVRPADEVIAEVRDTFRRRSVERARKVAS